MTEWLRVLIFQYHTFKPFENLTTVSDVGSSPTLGACETSQVLPAVVCLVCFFLWILAFSPPPTDWPISYELK